MSDQKGVLCEHEYWCDCSLWVCWQFIILGISTKALRKSHQPFYLFRVGERLFLDWHFQEFELFQIGNMILRIGTVKSLIGSEQETWIWRLALWMSPWTRECMNEPRNPFFNERKWVHICVCSSSLCLSLLNVSVVLAPWLSPWFLSVPVQHMSAHRVFPPIQTI